MFGKKAVIVVVAGIAVLTGFLLLLGCDRGDDDMPIYGSLVFRANGEDFARDGFTSKDGWDISFTHAYVCISGPTAFQVVEPEPTPHAGHSHAGIAGAGAHVALTGEYVVDLAQGSDATEIGKICPVAIGNYNRVSWGMKNASGDATVIAPMTQGELEDVEGFCLVLIGTACNGTTIDFTLKFDEEMFYMATEEHPDEIGVVSIYGTGYAEMTFHFDHIFGDSDTAPTDPLNLAAVGFDPFGALAVSDTVDETFWSMMQAMSAADFQKLLCTYLTLGHTGEGHCMFMLGLPGEEGESEPLDSTVYNGTGTIEFQANGEEFARDGFISKDGWDISFDKVIVNITDASALAITTKESKQKDAPGSYVMDICKGVGPTIFYSDPAPAGNYNRVMWEHHLIETTDTATTPLVSGDLTTYEGYSFYLVGSATKGTTTIDFTIKIDEELSYSATGPHPEGIGAFNDGQTGQAEMTFHFDHIFGDYYGGFDLNAQALGFDPVAALDTDHDNVVDVTLADMATLMTARDLYIFYKAFLTIGHCGEEHCFILLH